MYKKSDFPNLTGITKDWFMVYSADHGSVDCYVAQMDSPDFTGFAEIGAMGLRYGTDQSRETPRLYKLPDGSVQLYYHIKTASGQETVRYTATGSFSLQNVDTSGEWTYDGTVLGLYPNDVGGGETHTGYFKMLKDPTTEVAIKNEYGYYEAWHSGKGSDTGLMNSFEFKKSFSADGVTWYRNDLKVFSQNIDLNGGNLVAQLEASYFIKIQNVNVRFTFYRETSANEFANGYAKIGIFISDKNYEREVLLKAVTCPYTIKTCQFKYDPTTQLMHVYASSYDDVVGNSRHLYYASMDMSNAANWAGITDPGTDYPDRAMISSFVRSTNNNYSEFVFTVGEVGDSTNLDDLHIYIYRMNLNTNCFTIPYKDCGTINNPLNGAIISRIGNQFSLSHILLSTSLDFDCWIVLENGSGKKSCAGNHGYLSAV